LRVISLIEGGDPLALFNFARARDQARQRFRLNSTNILDEFYLYRKNDYSFYFSDQAPPDIVSILPGDSLNAAKESRRRHEIGLFETEDDCVMQFSGEERLVQRAGSSPIFLG
jgi:hypothetical protein